MFKKLAVGVIAAGALMAATMPAHAGGHVSVSLGVGLPLAVGPVYGTGYYGPPPVAYAPPPAYYGPPVVYAPAPRYYAPVRYYGPPRYYGPRAYGPGYYGPRGAARIDYRGGGHWHR